MYCVTFTLSEECAGFQVHAKDLLCLWVTFDLVGCYYFFKENIPSLSQH